MVLLLDIGNTHTHLGLTAGKRIHRHADIPTARWFNGEASTAIRKFLRGSSVNGIALCSVVPRATRCARRLAKQWSLAYHELTPRTVYGVGINYPKPETIGPDRLANAVAVNCLFGPPAVVIDFGTAVTFDVVNARGEYVGGIIAPGLAAMTDYLHEKTALLPRIRIRDTTAVIGRNTEEAMLIGAVHGYRGLIRELLKELKTALGCRTLKVVATGGYAELLASNLPEIRAVDPLLTLEGLRIVWNHRDLRWRGQSCA